MDRRKKCFIRLLLLSLLCLLCLMLKSNSVYAAGGGAGSTPSRTAHVEAKKKTQAGWKKQNGKWYFYSSDGRKLTGWQTIRGKRYYLGKDGAKRTEWKSIDGKRYYFGKNGVRRTGWKKIAGKKYYFGKNGAMVTGWKKIGKKKYYFSENGVLNTKTTLVIKGITYRFRKDGSYVEKKTCAHKWVWETHEDREWVPPVTHQEPVYDDGWTEYIYAKKIKCGSCEKYFDTKEEFMKHDLDHSCGSYSHEKVIVDQIYHEPEIIDYDTVIDVPGYWNEVVVKDYQYCSKCGKQK